MLMTTRSVAAAGLVALVATAAQAQNPGQDAIGFLNRSLALNSQAGSLQSTYHMLAAAHARLGERNEGSRLHLGAELREGADDEPAMHPAHDIGMPLRQLRKGQRCMRRLSRRARSASSRSAAPRRR